MVDTATQILTALEWYTDQGLDICLLDETVNRLTYKPAQSSMPQTGMNDQPQSAMDKSRSEIQSTPEEKPSPPQMFLGKSDAQKESIRLAREATTLEELRTAIAEFDGISLKRTASNMVFGAGNPKADIMLIGEAPGADEDRIGVPFAGLNGQLLSKILACINLTRDEDAPAERSVYISNILNWRPPGNRTPSPSEIEVSLPFIERHIQLVSPKIIILCGGISAKALLGREESLSRLRNCWHDYTPRTQGLKDNENPIAALATYHPSSLLNTSVQKKMVWADMLKLHHKSQL